MIRLSVLVFCFKTNRGYYMAARRYEISLRTSEIFSNTRREISSLQAAMWRSIYYMYTKENPNHFTWIFFFAAKGVTYYVAIATLIFSHVKITCYFHVWRYNIMFPAKAHLFLHWCLYNKTLYLSYVDFNLNGKYLKCWSDAVL